MSILPILRGHRKPKQRFHPRPAGCTDEFTMLLMGEKVTRNSGSWSTEEWSDGYYRKAVTEHSQSKLTIPQTSNMELPPYKSWLHSHPSQTLTNHLCKVANKGTSIHTASPFLRGRGSLAVFSVLCSDLVNSFTANNSKPTFHFLHSPAHLKIICCWVAAAVDWNLRQATLLWPSSISCPPYCCLSLLFQFLSPGWSDFTEIPLPQPIKCCNSKHKPPSFRSTVISVD